MFFLGANDFEVSDKIKLLNENKAAGIDKISAKVFQLSHGASSNLQTNSCHPPPSSG